MVVASVNAGASSSLLDGTMITYIIIILIGLLIIAVVIIISLVLFHRRRIRRVSTSSTLNAIHELRHPLLQTRLPPPKEVMFSLRSCLSVCPSDNWKSCEQILTKFLGGVGHCPGTNKFKFGDDPDNCQNPGVRSPKSGFTGLSKKLPTDFD